jgi:hypothetical protein
MLVVFFGLFLLILGGIMLLHNRDFSLPRWLDVFPAIFITAGVISVIAGVFQIA